MESIAGILLEGDYMSLIQQIHPIGTNAWDGMFLFFERQRYFHVCVCKRSRSV